MMHFWEAVYACAAALLIIGALFIYSVNLWFGLLWIAVGCATWWFARTCRKASNAEMERMDKEGQPR